MLIYVCEVKIFFNCVSLTRHTLITNSSLKFPLNDRKKILLPPIRLGREVIARTEKIKFLGITLDENLNFENHINEICNKLSRSVGILYKLKSFLPEKVLKNLYYTLVHPYVNYNIESWFGASEYVLDRVRILQRKSLRAVFNLPYNDHTNSFFKNNLILKLDELYKFNLSKSMFNYINNPIPCSDYISSCLSYNSNYHSYQTRTQNDLSIIRFNRTSSQSSFIYQGTKVWNKLPQSLHKSLEHFATKS